MQVLHPILASSFLLLTLLYRFSTCTFLNVQTLFLLFTLLCIVSSPASFYSILLISFRLLLLFCPVFSRCLCLLLFRLLLLGCNFCFFLCTLLGRCRFLSLRLAFLPEAAFLLQHPFCFPTPAFLFLCPA